jgi:hypothetical protein
MRPKRAIKAEVKTPGSSSSQWCVVLLGVVIVFFSLVRIRLLNMPLERDEGEYAYAGQLMLQGVPPYVLAYNMKLPGTYAAYSLIMALFGQSPVGIHIGLLLVNAGTAILLFLLVQRLFGPLAGLAAGASYALLSTSVSVLGFAAHATHFVALASVAGILLLLMAIDSKRMLFYFLSGFLLGLAFIFKQPGIFFVLFGGLFLLVREWPDRGWRGLARHMGAFSASAALPFALTCGILFFAGVLGKMWFWTFSYGVQYASSLSLSQGWLQLSGIIPTVFEPALFVWALAGLGLVALAWDSRNWQNTVFAIGFLLFSWAAVCPGVYFRQHYFIVFLSAVCLLVGVAVSTAERELSRHFHNSPICFVPLLVLLAAMVVSVAGQREAFFQMDLTVLCRYIYGDNPFPEAQTIADYLERNTPPQARIAVLGSEPEIYFYSKRHSATGYIYTYPLMESQKFALDMQKEMVKEIESSRPDFMVFVQIPLSWLASSESNPYILDWFGKYVAENYELTGIVDEVSPETQFVWGDAAKSYRVQSDASLSVYKRRNAAPSQP